MGGSERSVDERLPSFRQHWGRWFVLPVFAALPRVDGNDFPSPPWSAFRGSSGDDLATSLRLRPFGSVPLNRHLGLVDLHDLIFAAEACLSPTVRPDWEPQKCWGLSP